MLVLELEGGPLGVSKGPASITERRRILVVEDDDDFRQMLVWWLRREGHDVWEAATGPEGLALARNASPDVVLLDMGLPEMDGFAVAASLAKDPGPRRARLIALTGQGSEADRAALRDAGFDAHLLKPVSFGDLLAAIAKE